MLVSARRQRTTRGRISLRGGTKRGAAATRVSAGVQEARLTSNESEVTGKSAAYKQSTIVLRKAGGYGDQQRRLPYQFDSGQKARDLDNDDRFGNVLSPNK